MPAFEAQNPLWLKNISTLRERERDLATFLSAVSFSPDEIQLTRAADGSPILVARHENGEYIPLADPNSPVLEAWQWVLNLGKECLQCAHVMLIGVGSGYHALELHHQSDGETFLWLVEPNPARLKAVFCGMDLTDLIRSPRVRWVVGKPETEIARLLFAGPWAQRMRAQGIRMVIPAVMKELYADFIEPLAQAIAEAIEMDKLRFKTEEIQGKKILRNLVANFPLIFRGAPLLRLLGSASGYPALVISPGPSLEEALEAVRCCQDNTLLIAVDTAHRILHQNHISSDLVVSLDFTELNARHFETIQQDTALLAAFTGIDPQIPRKYEGRTFFYTHSAGPFQQMFSALGPLGELISYGSTAHAAYHLARLMGCSPIILVGNDLAFPQNRWYARGAMQDELEQPERERETLLEVPANDGGTVKTNGLYKLYLETFTKLIRETAGAVINTSPHGAKIEGCLWRPLEAALNFIPQQPIDKTFLSRALTPNLESQRKAALRESEALRERCLTLRSRLSQLARKAEALNPSDDFFPRSMRDLLMEFNGLLSREPSLFNAGIALCARSRVALLGQTGEVGLLGGKTREQNRFAQERCVAFFEGFQKAFHAVLKALEQLNRECVR